MTREASEDSPEEPPSQTPEAYGNVDELLQGVSEG